MGWAWKPIPLLIFVSPQPLCCVMLPFILLCSGWGWWFGDLSQVRRPRVCHITRGHQTNEKTCWVHFDAHCASLSSCHYHQPPPLPLDTPETSEHSCSFLGFWPSPATTTMTTMQRTGGWVCFTHPSTRYVFLRKYVLANNLFTTHRSLGWHLLTPPILSTTRGHLLATSTPPPPSFSSLFSRLVPLYHHHPSPSLPPLPPFSLGNEHTHSFSRLVALCHHPSHSNQAHTLVFEGGCSLPPPAPSSLETEHMRSFSRLVALCHHHPSPSKTSVRSCFRGRLFFATTSITLLPRKRAYVLVFETGCSLPPPSSLENEHLHSFSWVFNFLNVYNIINNIYIYFIWFRASGPFVQVWVLLGYTLIYFQLSLVCLI